MVDKKEVLRIAKLARIKLTDKEVEKFGKDFSDILDYFDTLKKVDLKDILPMTHSTVSQNVVREDEGIKANVEVKNKIVEMTDITKEGFSKVKSVLK